MITVTNIQIRTTCAIIYPSFLDRKKSHICRNITAMPTFGDKKTYSGTVTNGAKKRITKAVTLLIQSTPTKKIINEVTGKSQNFKLSFITLTVSSNSKMLTAKEAHKNLLEPLLLFLRRHHGMKSYIWKAELQKRGQIHYHITSDCFINHTHLRNKWNELQSKHNLLDDYYNDNGHYNANSTDIHSVYKVKNIEAYLIKYLAKADSESQSTEGKIWDCSKNLKSAKYYTTVVDGNYINSLEHNINYETAEVKHFDFHTLVIFKKGTADQLLNRNDRIEYREHMRKIRSGVINRPSINNPERKVLEPSQTVKKPINKQLRLSWKI